MQLLLAEQQKTPRSVGATIVSITLHAGVVILVALTGRQVVDAVRVFVEESVQYLYPVPRDIGTLRPGLESAPAPADRRIFGTVTPPWREGVSGAGGVGLGAHDGAIFTPSPSDAETIEPGIGDNAMSTLEVDSIAVFDATSAAPEYPQAMALRRVEGTAVLRFVIDSTGLIDMSTVRVMSATHSAFARSVLEAMPHMKFRPASIAGHPVRLLVEQMFSFKIQKPKKAIS
ncbi:MAG: energy transducer TonB [Gemmatimonadaceae bacterium]|nr:energy transducer TonB [Gemmatimonadaceae bacterium]